MNLEDHVGDIIRKARAAAGVSAEETAKAAGLTAEALGALEQSGTTATRPNWSVLAARIGLHGAKLERIANGWLPAAVDLSRWREIRPITTTQEGITVNCYLVWDEVTREAALFDTGWD